MALSWVMLWVNPYHWTYLCLIFYISTVPLRIVPMVWLITTMVGSFVLIMSWSLEHIVVFRDVHRWKSLEHRLVLITKNFGTDILFVMGARWLLRRTDEENLPWLPTQQRNQHPHEEPAPNPQARHTYFSPNRFYCVKTLYAPCGVVIVWIKFPKAESPTNILWFLESVYPTEESRPDYICIDKACLILKHAINNDTWPIWSQTSWCIVDSYHYMNHRTSDYLCRKWCNRMNQLSIWYLSKRTELRHLIIKGHLIFR